MGALLGIFIFYGLLFYTKKSVVQEIRLFGTVFSLIVGAILGVKKGVSLGEKEFIMNVIGQNECTTNFIKDGKFWVGVSEWTDKRLNTQYKLLTARSNKKYIVSALDNRIIIKHNETSASKITIPKLHENAKKTIFKQISEHYYHFNGESISNLFDTITESD